MKLSVAIPESALSDDSLKIDKTRKISVLARACSIFKTDTIYVYGTVITGTVDLVIDDYSGTWVWKVYEAQDEVVITDDPTYSVLPDDGFLVSYAKGRPTVPDDPLNDKTGEPYDAVVEVLDGSAQLTIGGKGVKASAGQIIIMPKNVPHAVAAEERFKMLLTMIRA